jgi:ribosome biogenesis protein Nip4
VQRYRFPNTREETILKRAYSNWNIFEVYDKEKLIVASLITPTPAPTFVKTTNTKKTGLQASNPYFQNNTKSINATNMSKNLEKNPTYVDNSNFSKIYLWAQPSPLEHDNLLLKLHPVLMGIQIGIIKGKKFFPGLNFAELVLNYHRNNTCLEFPYVVVNDKAANLVCFGRDIMGNSLVSYYDKIKDNQLLIILNENNEVLGLGRSRFASPLLSRPNVITVDTIENIGTFYLQNENKSLKEKH